MNASSALSWGHRDPVPDGVAEDAGSLRDRIVDELCTFLAEKGPEFARPADLDEIHGMLREYVVNLGKCLRSGFCYWGWRGAGGRDSDQIVRAGAALELFQAFALVHDDIMDASDLRRGRPTLHRALAGLHRRRRWHGASDHFGLGGAILLGDLCLCYSDEILDGCGVVPERLRPARRLVHLMRTEVMIGQSLDLLGQATGGSVEDALRIVRLKAATYTIERPLQIGAVLAGGGQDLLDACTAYAIPLGEAFQLRDDVLGAFGERAVTGKPVSDLSEGKQTVLMALARDRAAPRQRAVIERLHGSAPLGAADEESLRAIVRDTDALRDVEQMIVDRAVLAREAAERMPVPEPVRRALIEMVTTATVRAA